MSEEKQTFRNCYECPMCFLIFHLEELESNTEDVKHEKKCDFCEGKTLTDLELFTRRIVIMERTTPSHFPTLFRQLISHLELK